MPDQIAPPAPTQTPAPAPAQTPSPAPAPQPAPSDDAFASLDAKARQKPAKPAAAPADPAKPEPAKPDPAKPDPQPTDPAATGPKALRAQLEKTSAELASYKQKIQLLEDRIAKGDAAGKDTTALAEQLATEKKEKAELQAQVRSLKREASPEFVEKFDKPFNQSAQYAKRVVEQMTVTVPSGDPNVAPTTRPATWEDFIALYHTPPNKAYALAKEMFGDASQVVITQLSELQRMDFQRQTALREEKENADKREREETARSATEREAIAAMWTKVNQDIAERTPEYFQPDPKDAEGSALLSEGYKLVDADRKGLSVQQNIVRDAQIRHRAAAHSYLVHKIERVKERIAELEAENAELKGNGPGTVINPGGAAAPSGDKDMFQELRESGAIKAD